MKKNAILLLMISAMLVGCSVKEQAETQVIDDSVQIVEHGTVDVGKVRMTVEDVEMLASKRGELSIEDFEPYIDLSDLYEQGSLWETVEFQNNGETMCLRISASDKELISAPYEGALDGAVLFHSDFLKLDSMEKEYAYQGSCADIRAGNIHNILNGTVKMQDYMSIEFPDNVSESKMKFWLGSHGGVTFLREGENEEEMTIENAGIYAEQQSAGGIEIWGTGELEQSIEVVSELDELHLGDVKLWRGVLQTDQGFRWYAAYTVKEGSSISYCVYLNKNEYTEKEFLLVTETIVLNEYAIY